MQNNTTQHNNGLERICGPIQTFDTYTSQKIEYRRNGRFYAVCWDVVELEQPQRAAFLEYSAAIDALSTQGGREAAHKMMRGGYCAPAAIAYVTKTDIVDVVRNGIREHRIMASGIPGVTNNPNRWTGTKVLDVTGRVIEILAFGRDIEPPMRFERVQIDDTNKTAGRLAKNYPNDTFVVVHGGQSGTHAFAVDRGTHCDWTYKPKTRLCDIWRVVK